MKTVKVGNTTFNAEAVKSMGVSNFKRTYSFLKVNLEDAWFKITGEKAKPEKKENKDTE